MATADPAKLMVIDNGIRGFGSAVTGSGGKILSHAPFVPAGQLLLPVVAPLATFVTVSSMLAHAQLKRVEAAIADLQQSLNRIETKRQTADCARLRVAVRKLGGLWEKFVAGQRFDHAMTVSLDSARTDLHELLHAARASCGPGARTRCSCWSRRPRDGGLRPRRRRRCRADRRTAERPGR